MLTYKNINARKFPPTPTFFEDLSAWIKAAHMASSYGFPMPSPARCVSRMPVEAIAEDSFSLRLRAVGDEPGQTPRWFDTPLGLLVPLTVYTVGASFGINPVDRTETGRSQFYPKWSFPGVEGGSFSFARLANDTPKGKRTRSIEGFYDWRSRNLVTADLEYEHKFSTLNGRQDFRQVALARYDRHVDALGRTAPINRQTYAELIDGLLEVQALRERLRLSLQAA